ncbi:hypothetical protein GCM10028791_41780 [Echinicola sediminis]
MINKRNLLLFAIGLMVILSSRVLKAQEIKLGRYSQEELEMSECAFEPEASAVVLGEQGISFFSNSQLITETKRRIKIFDVSAKEYADVIIRFYEGDDRMESVSGLKAQVMNYENGKEEIIKMSKKDFFETEVGNGYKEIRFTFPNVKEGSILEYEYNIYSKSLTFLDGWSFQNDIPTVFSKYQIEIPEYLDYRFLGQGEHFILANQQRKESGTNEWVLENLKSIKPEPYMENFVDYLDKIEFQLAGYKDFSNQGHYTPVLSTWQKLADELYDIESFKSYFRNNGPFKDLQEIKIEGETQLAKAENIYQYIKDHYTLNDERGFVPDQSMRKLIEGRVGSKAELNLLLIAMLRANDIEALPLLISSKGNGRSYLVQFPFVRQFNRLIVKAAVDGEEMYGDTSDEFVPFGYLPLSCHVEGGFLVREQGSDLERIGLDHKSGIKQMVDISLEADSLHYDHKVRYLDYDAISFLEKYEEMDVQKAGEWLKLEDNAVVSTYSMEQTEGKTKQVENSFMVDRLVNTNADMVLVNPIIIARFKENPFKIDERIFPVDFNYLISDNYIANIKIPEGYELDDFPEQLVISIPGGAAKFVYIPQEDPGNNMLRINIMFDLKKEMVQPQEYPGLKAFMEYVVNKIQEPVVLKKRAGA